MELDVTWKRAARVWLAYLWRNMLAIIAAMILGGIVGGIFAFILSMLGVPQEIIMFIVSPIAFVSGIGISIIPIKLILNKDFGEFRLVLIENAPSENT